MKKLVLFAILAFLLIFSSFLLSQSKETGAIIGTVTDQQGAPLQSAMVTVSCPKMIGIRSAITEADGAYGFPALRPGLYTIKAELDGFKTVVLENVRLTTTARLELHISLEQSATTEE